MNDIRKYLAVVINDENEENWYKPDLFQKNTLSRLPPELKVISLPPKEEDNYNCFIYTLHLEGNKPFLSETHGFIYSNFFQTLIDKKELEITNSPTEGDIILYRNPGQFGSEITHAGILSKDRLITSKWSWGPIIGHSVFDVPDFYGNDVSYAKGISEERAKQLFDQYKEFNINIHSN